MILISLNVPRAYLQMIENLVRADRFPNRSEAIRVAIRDLIKEEFKRAKHEMNGKDFEAMNNVRYQDDSGEWRTFRVIKVLG